MIREFLKWCRLRWRGLFSRHSHETGLDREMQFHVDMLVQQNLAAGMTPDEAQSAAQREFGGATQYREECRDTWRSAIVSGLIGDFTYAARALRRSPGFTAVAVLTLALGIGVNIVVFSFVRETVLAPLFRDNRLNLVALYNQRSGADRNFRYFSYAEFTTLQESRELFTDVAAMNLQIAAIGPERNLQRRFLAFVSENYFATLGVQPVQGRFFTAEESRPGAAIPVLIANHALWERLGKPADFIGSTLRVNNRRYTVIGLMPKGFVGLHVSIGPDAWLPLGEMAPVTGRDLNKPTETRFTLVARLRPELSREAATRRLAPINQRLNALPPADQSGPRQLVLDVPPRSDLGNESPDSEAPLAFFGVLALGLSLLVLSVACLNLANMLLARGVARHKELAIRLALGASRGRVIRGLLAEGLLLALLGGTLSVALGRWSSLLLAGWSLDAFAAGKFALRLAPFVDPSLIAATLGFSLLACVGFSLWPALRSTRADLFPDLKQIASGPPAIGRRRRFLPLAEMPLLAQIAISLVLLFSAALFVRSGQNAQSLDLGFQTAHQVIAQLDYKLGEVDPAVIPHRQQALLNSIATLPGVTGVALASAVPYNFELDHHPLSAADSPSVTASPADPNRSRHWAGYTAVTRGYFAIAGITLLSGRDFTPEENNGTAGRPVAIIDNTLAHALFGEANPLGRFVVDSNRTKAVVLEVVGVVRSPRDDVFGRAPERIYRPLGQAPESGIYFHVQVPDPAAFVTTLRQHLNTVAPETPPLLVRPFADFVEKNINVLLVRMAGVMFGLFGAIALILAAVGVYGVKAHGVAQRRREIGIRIALGAHPQDVITLILRQGAIQAAIGVSAGLILAIGAGRGLSAMLYKVNPLDVVALGGSVTLLGFAVLLACYVPARRATQVDPLVAIKAE